MLNSLAAASNRGVLFVVSGISYSGPPLPPFLAGGFLRLNNNSKKSIPLLISPFPGKGSGRALFFVKFFL